MNTFAHNGHDHTAEMAQAASNNQELLIVVSIAIVLIITIISVLFLKRKK